MNPLVRWVKKIIQFFRPASAPADEPAPPPAAEKPKTADIPEAIRQNLQPSPISKPAGEEKSQPAKPEPSKANVPTEPVRESKPEPIAPAPIAESKPTPQASEPVPEAAPKKSQLASVIEKMSAPASTPLPVAAEPKPDLPASTPLVEKKPDLVPEKSTPEPPKESPVITAKAESAPPQKAAEPKPEPAPAPAVEKPAVPQPKIESPAPQKATEPTPALKAEPPPKTEEKPAPELKPSNPAPVVVSEPAPVIAAKVEPVAEKSAAAEPVSTKSEPAPAPIAEKKPEPLAEKPAPTLPAEPKPEPVAPKASEPVPVPAEKKQPVFTGRVDYTLASVREALDKPYRLRHLEGMLSVHEIANRELLDLVPYEPGKPVDDVARELGLDPASIIKLASNENPLGPSPLAQAAMRDAIDKVHFYPDGGGFHLRNAIATAFGLGRANVVLGNGSNEIIELLFHTFTRPGIHEIVTSRHAFAVYTLMAQLFGVHAIEVDDIDFTPDLPAMLKAITPQTRLVFLASPNNPTGTRVSNEALEQFLKDVPAHVIVVLDEAYYEFLDNPPDTVGHVKAGDRIVLMRTFSKIQGLAGLRIGYGLAPAELADLLQRARQPFNANAIAQAGAMAGLADVEHQRKTKAITDEGRKLIEEAFGKMSLKYVPSAANFVLVNVGDGGEVFKRLMKKGIIVRSMVSYHLPQYIRVSIGTPEQNQRFLAELPAALEGLVTFAAPTS